MPASAVPSRPWYVGAASTGARRIDRSPAVLPQSFEPERVCVGRRMAAGRVTIERSLSAARNIRRAGLAPSRKLTNRKPIKRTLAVRVVTSRTHSRSPPSPGSPPRPGGDQPDVRHHRRCRHRRRTRTRRRDGCGEERRHSQLRGDARRT